MSFVPLFSQPRCLLLSQEPAPTPQYNVVTDAVLFDGGPSLGNSDKVRWDFYKAVRTGARTDTNAAWFL